eukprot:TRINITY_DN83258_c0_g1_i1.p1 TRINITY_DN83258_c0_g1~~TRINITY_DN83258_c0_g1_i1.p1  ORF type:complete len:962 (+),score=292.15 TRINITY_DN83258_c0_g1_i1:84-2969(+)
MDGDDGGDFKIVEADEGEGKKKKKVKPGSFQGLGISQSTYKAIMRQGYKMPTPIQRKTIPICMEGQDVVAMARTGSGKTCAFLVPIIERLKSHSVAVGVRAIVLSPTRELAMQTAKFQRQLGCYSGLRVCLLVGGQAMETQFAHLAANPDIIVATPGRLVHHMMEAELSLSRVEVMVMDEADRLFELGFAEQLQKVLEACPISRQCLLFSATLPSQLVSFSRAGLKDPVFVRLDVETTLSEQLELQFMYVRKTEKLAAAVAVLRRLLKGEKNTIMFVATRHHVEFFGELLKALGMPTSIVYGSMDQTAREEQVSLFRRKKTKIMVTTDVAARGIDIPLLDHVLNYDFPPSAKLFVHRSGRTARAGRSGLSISLVTTEDLPHCTELMLFLGQKMGVVGGSTEPESDGKKKALLGSVPALEYEVEILEKLIDDDGSVLKSLFKSMMASYGVYNKTRPQASKESSKRARELVDSVGGPARLHGLIHPAFRDEGAEGRGIGTAGGDNESWDFIQTLRGYRPKSEKVGNVLSSTAMKTMEQAKSESTATAALKKEFAKSAEEVEVEANAPEELDLGEGSDEDSEESEEEQMEDPRETLARVIEASAAKEARKRPREASAKAKGAPKRSRARLSKAERKKQGKGGSQADTKKDDNDAFDDFDVQVDGMDVASAGDVPVEDGPPKKKKRGVVGNFYLSVERTDQEFKDAKERGLDMEQYQLDLMGDEDGEIKSAKSVIKWDAKKKKYLPVMVAADGKKVKAGKRFDETGNRVKGDKEKSNIYQKWAQSSKLRVQRPGEMEQGVPLGSLKKGGSQARIMEFDDKGGTTMSGGDVDTAPDGRKRKPVVPFHGQIDEKYMTNKQKRMMKKRQKNDQVVHSGKNAKSELRSASQIQKEKKLEKQKKIKQSPAMRKKEAKEAKDKRRQMHEDRQMKFGARTRSKMLVFEGNKKWTKKGNPRKMTGHGRKGSYL